MPLCPRCSNPFTCKCNATPKTFGAVAADCPLKPGSVWVHVTDDRGIDVEGANATCTTKSNDPTPTDRDGTAIFAGLDPGTHSVTLEKLTSKLLEDFEEFEGLRNRPVTVAPGQIAYVPYQLFRKPALSVRVEKKKQRTPLKLFGGATVSTKRTSELEATTGRETGVADFGRVKSGPYTITVTLDPEDEKAFATKLDFPKEVEPVTLAQGQERVVVIEVEEINFVAGKAVIDNALLFIDEEPGGDDSVACVNLSLTQTNPDHRYTKPIRFKCASPTDVEAFLDKECAKPLVGSLNDGVELPGDKADELRAGTTVPVYLRGNSKPGKLEISLVLEEPGARFVKLGDQPPPISAEIEVLARPHVKIEWMDGSGGVENVSLAFAGFGETYDGPTSIASGLAKWAKRGIKPGPYNATVTFADNVPYLLHTDTGDPVVGKPSIDLKHKGAPVTFKIRKASVTLGATCETGGQPAEEIGGKVTVKLNPTPLTLTKGGGAKPVEIPVVEIDQKCLIEKFEPDGTDAYEFVKVDTTV